MDNELRLQPLQQSTIESEQQQQQQQQYPQARHHTYLSGVITPLLLSSWNHHQHHNNSPNNNNVSSNNIHVISLPPHQQLQTNDNNNNNNNIEDDDDDSKQQRHHPLLSSKVIQQQQQQQEMAILELSPECNDNNNNNDDDDDTTQFSYNHNNNNNIVIFPGSIVPLRLLDSEWITYIQQQIHSTTSTTKDLLVDTTTQGSTISSEVRFGILMPPNPKQKHIDDDDDDDDEISSHTSIPYQSQLQQQHRQSWTRQAHGPNTLRRLSDQLILSLGPNFDLNDSDDDDDYNDDDIEDRNRNWNSTTIVTEPEMTVTAQSQQNDDSVVVVSHGNDNLTLRHRIGDDDDNNNNSGTTVVLPSQSTAVATAVVVPISTTSATTTTTTTTTTNDTDTVDRNEQRRNFLRQQEVENINIRRSELLFHRRRRRQSQYTLEVRNRYNNRRHRVSQTISSSSSTSTSNRNNNNNNHNNNKMDRYIGRIGTIATVMYTHGNNDNTNNDVSTTAASSSSLVITAMGTSRFRIIGYRNDHERKEYHSSTSERNRHLYLNTLSRHRFGSLKHFIIEELYDIPMNLPIRSPCRPIINISETKDSTGRTQECMAASKSLKYYENYLLHLSIVSPHPKYILQKIWPWKIMVDICQCIQTVAPTLLNGMILPSLTKTTTTTTTTATGQMQIPQRDHQPVANESGNVEDTLENVLRYMDPGTFSYWMATNLPFRFEEKIELLEICSTIERLQYIYDKLRFEELFASKIHCIRCKNPIAYTYEMFTVDGADGTTGNYVNEYGHVHQTITVRSMIDDENGVWFQGQPQSQDSWFPGYCWTIMACAVCGHHLGWKFTPDDADESAIRHHNPQRLVTFYCVSAANVNTHIP